MAVFLDSRYFSLGSFFHIIIFFTGKDFFMQTLHMAGLNKLLHPERDKRSATERIFNHLSHSNMGLNRGETTADTGSAASALDSFSVTQNISELLSPACGMSEEEKKAYLAKIIAKLKSGKKLTSEEMRFLQAEDPQLYQQAARVQAMRGSLEAGLAHSASKEEAQSVYLDALNHISEDDPMKEYIIAAYDDAMKEFQKSDQYQSLPETKEDAAKQRTGSRHSNS